MCHPAAVSCDTKMCFHAIQLLIFISYLWHSQVERSQVRKPAEKIISSLSKSCCLCCCCSDWSNFNRYADDTTVYWHTCQETPFLRQCFKFADTRRLVIATLWPGLIMVLLCDMHAPATPLSALNTLLFQWVLPVPRNCLPLFPWEIINVCRRSVS